jgi:hypothetical protein
MSLQAARLHCLAAQITGHLFVYLKKNYLQKMMMKTYFKSRVSDPDSIRSVDPDPESGPRRAKMTHINMKKLRILMF